MDTVTVLRTMNDVEIATRMMRDTDEPMEDRCEAAILLLVWLAEGGEFIAEGLRPRAAAIDTASALLYGALDTVGAML